MRAAFLVTGSQAERRLREGHGDVRRPSPGELTLDQQAYTVPEQLAEAREKVATCWLLVYLH